MHGVILVGLRCPRPHVTSAGTPSPWWEVYDLQERRRVGIVIKVGGREESIVIFCRPYLALEDMGSRLAGRDGDGMIRPTRYQHVHRGFQIKRWYRRPPDAEGAA